MLNIKNLKVYKHNERNLNLHAPSTGNDFNITKFILETHGYSPSFLYIDEKFSEGVFDFLLENAELIRYSSTGKLAQVTKDFKNFRGGSFWFSYKDVYIKISAVGQEDERDPIDLKGLPYEFDSDDKARFDKKIKPKTFDIMFSAPSNVKDYHLEDFQNFILEHEGSKVHLFIKNQYGEYDFEPINVNLPKDINLELNYGKKFLEVDNKIQERLTNNSSGLFMFHGNPGTGKTTYIKYLASQIHKDFIYIPTSMIESFTSDPNCLSMLIQKPNSIIILEDAEKAIVKRHGDTLDSSAVSSLLNLSDGILSDILKTSVILTYNCPRSEIDSALKRKGRLQVDYEFDLLTIEDSKKLAKHLKHSKKTIDKITEPMSVADIYNLEKDVDLSETSEKNKEYDRVVGFAQN
jgi:hypothetical protein